jgi:hypothetical protein
LGAQPGIVKRDQRLEASEGGRSHPYLLVNETEIATGTDADTLAPPLNTLV